MRNLAGNQENPSHIAPVLAAGAHRSSTCILHARILHTPRSLVFVLGGTDDAAAAEQLEPEEQTAGEEADADNTGNDSDSSGAHLRYAYCTLHAHLFLF